MTHPEPLEALPRVTIVVLNYNGWQDTIECLESNLRARYRQIELVLVDNCSENGSLWEIQKWADRNGIHVKMQLDLQGQKPASYPVTRFRPGSLTLIQTGKNLGFSGGNNRGIEFALANSANFIFLLNNDTVVEENTLEVLVQSLQSNERIGAAYPLVLGLRGEVQVPVYLRPPLSFWEILLASNIPGFFWSRYQYRKYLERRNPYPQYGYDQMIAVPNIAIAHALYRRELFEQVGPLDENLFMYNEEGVLMDKLSRTSWVVCLEPRAKLTHKGGIDNSRLPSAFLYRKSVCGEMYYARRCLRLPMWQRAFLKLVRVGEYLYFALAKSSLYRASFSRFAKEYLAS